MRECYNGVILSSSQLLPVTQINPRKRAPGKIRARWSNKARYNPMKSKTPNAPEISVTNMDMTDMDMTKVPLSVKVHESPYCHVNFASSLFCIPHPKSQTGQMKIDLGDIQKHKSKQGRLTFYQTGTCPHDNITPNLNWK